MCMCVYVYVYGINGWYLEWDIYTIEQDYTLTDAYLHLDAIKQLAQVSVFLGQRGHPGCASSL